MAERIDAPIYSYRSPQDRELIARYWCEQRYGGKTSPEALKEVKEDLESLDLHALAYLWRECGSGERPIVQELSDSYDPWRSL